ncbi:polyprenyl synthetase family protein [Streptomyces sp. NPDC098781]|uniref:polyprenyl synthetase family protein n=1 Tax=Streptomyces sp. NPDC098781 TaxID=3366097 RepID=UPI0037F43BC8
MTEAFTTAGVAFQFANDLLGIWGDEAKTGKPTGSDLGGLKRTLATVDALSHNSAPGRELAACTPLCPYGQRATICFHTDAGLPRPEALLDGWSQALTELESIRIPSSITIPRDAHAEPDGPA